MLSESWYSNPYSMKQVSNFGKYIQILVTFMIYTILVYLYLCHKKINHDTIHHNGGNVTNHVTISRYPDAKQRFSSTDYSRSFWGSGRQLCSSLKKHEQRARPRLTNFYGFCFADFFWLGKSWGIYNDETGVFIQGGAPPVRIFF